MKVMFGVVVVIVLLCEALDYALSSTQFRDPIDNEIVSFSFIQSQFVQQDVQLLFKSFSRDANDFSFECFFFHTWSFPEDIIILLVVDIQLATIVTSIR